jgi:hypothetical protein
VSRRRGWFIEIHERATQLLLITVNKSQGIKMNFQFDDGGRAAAGFKGKAGDCVVRAVAVASGRPYKDVYRELAMGCGEQRATKRTGKRSASARNGINTKRKWFKNYMGELGFSWTPTMTIGSGCKVHLRSEELPHGRIVVALSRHYAAVIDGVLHDTYCDDRAGTRCVYGYWSKDEPFWNECAP